MTDPVLVLLAASSAAAAAAVVGVLPVALRDELPLRWMGWANALAGGMMMGAAYTLTAQETPPLELGAGALVGILFVHRIHRAFHQGSGPEDRRLDRVERAEPAHGYRVLLLGALHATWEGVAIGAAAVTELAFGVFLALALAVHNVPEATVLAAALRGQGLRLPSVAGLAVAVNLPQVLLAVAVYAVVSAAPAALSWALGFAAGALLHLVLVELLPASYRQAGKLTIALVAAVAMGIVVWVRGLV